MITEVTQIKKRLKYYDVPNVNHYQIRSQGQLKLLFNEIRFFIEEIKPDPKKHYKVIYIGSGKGYHIPKLIDMFSKYNITWIFYDPNGHCKRLMDIRSDRIQINDRLFLQEDISKITRSESEQLVFISDIRSSSGREPTTENLLFDYKIQQDFIEQLNPDFSLVKFRMPFVSDWDSSMSFNQPEGPQYIQCFSKSTSTEFRIAVPKNPKFKTIKSVSILKEYEEKFFWFNQRYRFQNDNDLKLASYILNSYNEYMGIPLRYDSSNVLNHLRFIVNSF